MSEDELVDGHALGTNCWCEPSVMLVEGTSKRVIVHKCGDPDELSPEEQAERTIAVFEAADQLKRQA